MPCDAGLFGPKPGDTVLDTSWVHLLLLPHAEGRGDSVEARATGRQISSAQLRSAPVSERATGFGFCGGARGRLTADGKRRARVLSARRDGHRCRPKSFRGESASQHPRRKPAGAAVVG